MSYREFTLICQDCKQTATHLVSYRVERDRKNGLPYIQGHTRCLACDSEHPTPEELFKANN